MENTINLVNIISQFIIGGAGIFIGWNANKIAKSNLKLAEEQSKNRSYKISEKERELLLNNYNQVSKAISSIINRGWAESEDLEIIWLARDQARLQLPKEIEDYTEELRDKIHKIVIIRGSKPSKGQKEWEKKVEEESRIFKELFDERPHEVYKKYLKIK